VFTFDLLFVLIFLVVCLDPCVYYKEWQLKDRVNIERIREGDGVTVISILGVAMPSRYSFFLMSYNFRT